MSRPAIAFIDRAAFAHNVEVLAQASPHSELIPMVKANAYGHGVARLFPEFQNRRVGVACIEEALELIALGFKNEIILLEGPFEEDCVRQAAGHAIVFVIHHPGQLELLERGHFEGKLWLKVDTGMHRLGLSEEQFIQCVDEMREHANWHLETVMTHFACADAPASDSLRSQINQFDALLAKTKAQLPTALKYSLCNSAGTLLSTDQQADIVRPGIALYGGMADPNLEAQYADVFSALKPVMRLRSKVIAIRTIQAGETVGYGDTWVAEQDACIATVAMGYGDGYPRHAPSGTPVYVAGQRCSLVGRVSMDMITVDVTELKDVQIGSEVEFWGELLSIDEVARYVGTISYELSTALTSRVPRRLLSY